MSLKIGPLTLAPAGHTPEEVVRIARSPEVAAYLTEKWTYPPGMPETMEFVIYDNEEIIGQVALKSIRWYNRKAELSLFIKPDFQGQGRGGKILEAMMEYAFGKLNLYRLEAEVLEYNEKALKMVEMLGFTPEGKLRQAKYHNGKYYDIFRYGILKHEFDVYYKERNP